MKKPKTPRSDKKPPFERRLVTLMLSAGARGLSLALASASPGTFGRQQLDDALLAACGHIHPAVEQSERAPCMLLLEAAGARLSATGLHACAFKGDAHTLETAIGIAERQGLHINSVDNNCTSALFYAAMSPTDNPEKARLLSRAGARIDHRDNEGYTVLHMAAWYKNFDTFHTLIELGADPEALDLDGFNALDFAEIGLRLDQAGIDNQRANIRANKERAALIGDGAPSTGMDRKPKARSL